MMITRMATRISSRVGRAVWIEADARHRLRLHLSHHAGWTLLAIAAGPDLVVMVRR